MVFDPAVQDSSPSCCPCCCRWVLHSEIIDSNSFPLECTHLLALGDSRVLDQLQLSHSYRGLPCKYVCVYVHVCVTSPPQVVQGHVKVSLHVCVCDRGRAGEKETCCVSVSWISPTRPLGQRIHDKSSRGNQHQVSVSVRGGRVCVCMCVLNSELCVMCHIL